MPNEFDIAAQSLRDIATASKSILNRAILGVTYVRAAERKSLATAFASLPDDLMARALLKLVSGQVPTSPVVLDIVIAAVPDIEITDNATFSRNFATTYVTGADASGATHALVATNGDSLATMGLAFTTSTLSTADANLGSGSYRYSVTKSGQTKFSNTFQIRVIPATVALDSLPPSIPAALTLVVNVATPSIVVSCEFPMDTRTVAIPPTDPVKVEIYRSVDGGAYVPLVADHIDAVVPAIAAAGAQPNPVYALYQIGGATAGSASVSGADITLSNVVDGLMANLSTACNFYAAQVNIPVGASVPFILPVDFVSAYEWSQTGWMLMETLAATAKCIYGIARPIAGAKPYTVLARVTEGQGLIYKNDLGGNVGVLRHTSAAQWDVYLYANGALSSTPATNFALQFASDVLWFGYYLSRETPGGAISSINRNTAINVRGRASYTDTGVLVGKTYSYRARGVDGA